MEVEYEICDDWEPSNDLTYIQHTSKESNENAVQNTHLSRSRKSVKRIRRNRSKYSQRFCDKWLQTFSPWLARSYGDANKPYCKACKCRLDCNRCHLIRHEQTTKHTRNLIQLLKGDDGKPPVSIRQERSKYYQQRQYENNSVTKENDSDYFREDDEEENNISNDTIENSEKDVDIYANEKEEDSQDQIGYDYDYEGVSDLQVDIDGGLVILEDEKNDQSLVAKEKSVDLETDGIIIYEKRGNLLINQEGNVQYELDDSVNYFMEDYEIDECISSQRPETLPNEDEIIQKQVLFKKSVDIQNYLNTSTIKSLDDLVKSSENNQFLNMDLLNKSKNQQKQEENERNKRDSQRQKISPAESSEEGLSMSTTTIRKTTMTSKSTPYVPTMNFNQQEKNHVDLFFESVSSSVKALSPKLIAETKMRVSQLICELELRSLTENDLTTKNTVHNLINPIPIKSQPQLQVQVPDNKRFLLRNSRRSCE